MDSTIIYFIIFTFAFHIVLNMVNYQLAELSPWCFSAYALALLCSILENVRNNHLYLSCGNEASDFGISGFSLSHQLKISRGRKRTVLKSLKVSDQHWNCLVRHRGHCSLLTHRCTPSHVKCEGAYTFVSPRRSNWTKTALKSQKIEGFSILLLPLLF